MDVAQQAADGSWAPVQSVLLRKRGEEWRVLAVGDAMDWDAHVQEMSADVRRAFDEWHAGHF